MTKHLIHKSGIHYEHSDGIFFGPKQKAVEELRLFNGVCLSEIEYIDYLINNYPSYIKHIEWIRFYNYKDKTFPAAKFNGQMRLALINVSPNIVARDIFFNERGKITSNTGRYPLIMGSRANFRMRKLNKLVHSKHIESIGVIEGFKIIANSDVDGISFELQGSNGSYLFDFGYNGVGVNNYKAFFLSHTHSDHSSGFENTIYNNRQKLTPTLSSKNSASFLEYKKENSNNIKFYKGVFHIDYKDEIELNDGLKITFFPIFHSLGSIGIRVLDKNDTSFFYLGDLCLKNGYTDFSKSIVNTIQKLKTSKNILLLDGAMIGRKLYIEEQDTPELILSEFAKNVTRRNIIFFSNQPENSIYAYLKVYQLTQKIEELKQIKLFVSQSLFQSLKLLIEPVILDHTDFKDIVYTSLFGQSKSNPIESQRLYPLNEEILRQIDLNERIIVFAGLHDLKKYHSLKQRFEKSDIILAGTFALRDDLPEEIAKSKPRSIIRVASENWGFHSSQEDIKEFINAILPYNFKVYIFHNYFSRLTKFINESDFNRKVIALGDRTNFEKI
jgi:hypothetical protein